MKIGKYAGKYKKITFASNVEIKKYTDIEEQVFKLLNIDTYLISDESTLSDFNIKDVSAIESRFNISFANIKKPFSFLALFKEIRKEQLKAFRRTNPKCSNGHRISAKLIDGKIIVECKKC